MELSFTELAALELSFTELAALELSFTEHAAFELSFTELAAFESSVLCRVYPRVHVLPQCLSESLGNMFELPLYGLERR